MTVDVDEPDQTERVPGAGQCTGQQGAAAAEQERPLAGGAPLGDDAPEHVGRRQDAGLPDEAGRGVTVVVRDPDREIARIGPAEPVQARRADRRRRSLGAVRLGVAEADRVDRHAEGRERASGGGRTHPASLACPPLTAPGARP